MLADAETAIAHFRRRRSAGKVCTSSSYCKSPPVPVGRSVHAKICWSQNGQERHAAWRSALLGVLAAHDVQRQAQGQDDGVDVLSCTLDSWGGPPTLLDTTSRQDWCAFVRERTCAPAELRMLEGNEVASCPGRAQNASLQAHMRCGRDVCTAPAGLRRCQCDTCLITAEGMMEDTHVGPVLLPHNSCRIPHTHTQPR